jgi:hypothetical protein
MSVGHEVIFEFSKLVNEHTAYLSKIVGGLVVLEVLIIAHVLTSLHVSLKQSHVSWVLFASALVNVLSLTCGYFADAATLWALQNYASGKDWHPSSEAEVLNLFQMIFLLVGLVLFLLAFFFYSRILAANLIKAGLHSGGKGGE